MGALKWRELEIETFANIGAKEFLETSEKILMTLSTLGLPVRIFERNVWKPEKSGILRNVKRKNGTVVLIINGLDPNKRGRKTHEIVVENEISVGLPIFA
ncbi:MAG: hypothetical protein PHE77_01860 [Candidatus Pacebacteria bacterium]|nr:hypothetical protein [Candidatus Paceibacterota bacterium]